MTKYKMYLFKVKPIGLSLMKAVKNCSRIQRLHYGKNLTKFQGLVPISKTIMFTGPQMVIIY